MTLRITAMDCEIFEEQVTESVNFKNLIVEEETGGPVETGERTKKQQDDKCSSVRSVTDTPSVHALVSI